MSTIGREDQEDPGFRRRARNIRPHAHEAPRRRSLRSPKLQGVLVEGGRNSRPGRDLLKCCYSDLGLLSRPQRRTQPEKARELCAAIDDKILPILKKKAGFVDETVLASDTESNRVLALSFWNAKEDAERYHREQYPKINEMVSHLLDTAPVIRTFDVHTSTTHRVAAGKAG